ncbi:MAG: group II intron reverse transcriptase/maturase [Coleofasciculus sp. C1-SOL-03]|jgi:RNA-directed DNA polymerase|uniref:group II intron reverse transcriptase/maturase n=1 Tax=Coleofasciculus sp. C1-SOL-03 TaxID=3069522 RepID=UPI003301D1E5
MNTDKQPMYEWNQIPWRKLEKMVFKLQKRIYRASSRGDVRTVRRLQKLLMKSWAAKCLAVRRVSQENQGKKTAGVDGQKSLTPKQRLNLLGNLKLGSKVKPTRRIWIPKPGKEEKRPLGIPTMKDRALQALVKTVLEPEWEARFESNSYGFRPGRSCQDAIEAIFTAINRKPKWVLDADIAKCFDKIDHKQLLTKLNTSPTIGRQIRAWLKAGVMDGNKMFPTSEGTPQGGVISPLLANIALHGMEERVKQFAETLDMRDKRGKQLGKSNKRQSLNIIRYADDFVILHESLTVVQRCKEIISEWLKGMGLELKPEKTRLAHTLVQYEQQSPGFDFLGFQIRQFPVGKHHSGTDAYGNKLGFKTIITPSKESIKVHYEKLCRVINAHRAAPQAALISKLNLIIKGWANYYSSVSSTETFSELDDRMYHKLRAWAEYRHPRKTWGWVKRKYWHSRKGDNWTFLLRDNQTDSLHLIDHVDTKIVRHTKVKGDTSPFNGNWVYWTARMGKHPEISKRMATLLKRQKGKCTHCGLYFKDGDLIEIDHKIPKSRGGKDILDNLQALHRHCHDEKTTRDGSLGTHDKCQSIEEPCEVKVSRTVLKPSMGGNFHA